MSEFLESEDTEACKEPVHEIVPYLLVKIPKKPIFAVMTILLAFVIAETVHRVMTARKLKRRAARAEKQMRFKMIAKLSSGLVLEENNGKLAVVNNPLIGYRLQPNQKTSYMTINAQGFRGADWVKEKTPGKKRVIILGSSVVFGYGIDADEKVFSALIEKKLAALYGQQKIEVLNAGVPAYHSVQDFINFAKVSLDYKPDLIVLFSGWNDFFAGGKVKPGEPNTNLMFKQLEQALEKSKSRSWNPLELSSFYDSYVKTMARARRKMAKTKSLFQENPRALSDYISHLELTVRLAQSYKIKVLIAPQPDIVMHQGQRPISKADGAFDPDIVYPGYVDYARSEYPKYHKSARALADQMNVPFFDTSLFLKDRREEILFDDPVHFNEQGHEYCAEALAPVVAKILEINK